MIVRWSTFRSFENPGEEAATRSPSCNPSNPSVSQGFKRMFTTSTEDVPQIQVFAWTEFYGFLYTSQPCNNRIQDVEELVLDLCPTTSRTRSQGQISLKPKSKVRLKLRQKEGGVWVSLELCECLVQAIPRMLGVFEWKVNITEEMVNRRRTAWQANSNTRKSRHRFPIHENNRRICAYEQHDEQAPASAHCCTSKVYISATLERHFGTKNGTTYQPSSWYNLKALWLRPTVLSWVEESPSNQTLPR